MAATVNSMTITGRDGIPFTVSLYNAVSAAVGTYLRCDMNQVAVATSPDNCIIPKDGYISEFIAGAASGQLEFISNGKSTGIFLDLASHGATNAGRPRLAIPVSRGTELRLKVVSVFPA